MAYNSGHDGTDGGMRAVLDLITEGVKTSAVENHIRHAFATAALERNADIKALSDIMGSSPKTLMETYQHVSSQLRKETVAKIPGLSGPTNWDQFPKK